MSRHFMKINKKGLRNKAKTFSIRGVFWKISVFIFFFQELVSNDSEDKSGCNFGKSYVSEVKGKSADSADKDYGYNEEVSVITEVNFLYHLKTGYCDETVEGYTYAAHYAVRNGSEEGYERSEEGDYHAHDRGCDYGYYGSVSGDSYAADGFAVGSVRAAAEERACHGTYAVAEESMVKTGIFKKIMLDYGGEVLVVSDVLCEYYECDGDIRYCHSCKILSVNSGEAFKSVHKGEIGDFKDLHIAEYAEIDYLESGVIGADTDNCEYGSGGISRKDTDYERNELEHFFAVYGAEHYGKECNKPADKSKIGVSGGYTLRVKNFSESKIAYCVSGKGKTDY